MRELICGNTFYFLSLFRMTYFYTGQVVLVNRNPAYGSYEGRPEYSTAVDNNPYYGQETNNWEGGVVTDINHEYQIGS